MGANAFIRKHPWAEPFVYIHDCEMLMRHAPDDDVYLLYQEKQNVPPRKFSDWWRILQSIVTSSEGTNAYHVAIRSNSLPAIGVSVYRDLNAQIVVSDLMDDAYLKVVAGYGALKRLSEK